MATLTVLSTTQHINKPTRSWTLRNQRAPAEALRAGNVADIFSTLSFECVVHWAMTTECVTSPQQSHLSMGVNVAHFCSHNSQHHFIATHSVVTPGDRLHSHTPTMTHRYDI